MYEKSLRWEYFVECKCFPHITLHFAWQLPGRCYRINWSDGSAPLKTLRRCHLRLRHVQDMYTRCNGWSFSRSSVLGSQMLLTVVKKAICKLKVYSWAGMYELSLWDETCKPHHIVTTQRSPFVICSCFFLPFLHPEPFVVLFGLPVLFAEPGFGGVLCARAGELLDIFGLSNLINLLGVLQSIAFF